MKGQLSRTVLRGGSGGNPASLTRLYSFVQMLTYKCQFAGKELVQLDERDTSKMCSGCGQKQPMPLYKRTYRCGNCGLVLSRDENSAINIRQRYLARLGPQAQAS